MVELVDHNQNTEVTETLTKTDTSVLQKKFTQLPELDQRIFEYGSVFIGANTAVSGLVANNLFSKLIKVRPNFLLSSLVVAGLPFFQTKIYYEMLIPSSLMAGAPSSPVRNTVGILVGTGLGSMTAISLAAAINTGYLVKDETKYLQDSAYRFAAKIFKPVLIKMRFLFLFQAAFSAFLAYEHYAIYEKMLQMPDDTGIKEEKK